MNKILDDILAFFNNYAFRIITALAVLIVCGLIIHYIIKGIKRVLYKTSLDNSVVLFVTALIQIVLWVMLIFICAGILNLSTSSFVVCLSSVALAIGLALKDSISNLTNGILIIYNKPFKRDDYVSIGGQEGKIQNIKLFVTELITNDNKKVVIPNSIVSTSTIINFSTMPVRRLQQTYSVAYGSDLDKVEEVIKQTLLDNKLILQSYDFSIFLQSHNSSSLDYCVRCWVDLEDYWTVYNALPRQMYDSFVANDIEIPFNQLDVNLKNPTIKKEDK